MPMRKPQRTKLQIKFTREFKLTAVRRLESGQSVREVARALEVHPSTLRDWRAEFREHPERAFPGNGHARVDEGRAAELERKIGQQALERFFKTSLAACRGTSPAAGTEQRRAF
jgi:putative transposase